MSGIAIIVPDVDWSSNNVGKVTIMPEVSNEARDLYNNYIAKSGREGNVNLLLLISELVDAGFMVKCTGLFYLGSQDNNLEYVKYSVTDLRPLTISGTPLVAPLGSKSNNSGFFIDKAYDLGNKGLLSVFMIAEEGNSYSIDWGRDMNGPTYFSSFGGFVNKSSIVCWCGQSAVAKDEDTAPGKGVFSIYARATELLYIHGNVTLNKTVNQYTGSWAPALLNYPSVNVPSTATLKMYATFNEDLTDSEVKTIHGIFKKYENDL